MTLVSEIIQSAYREGNLIPSGTDPTADEQAEALARLNTIILYTLGAGMGENVYDWLVTQPQRTAPVAANYPQLPLSKDTKPEVYQCPPKNSRIVWNGVTTTVYFPEAPSDGSRMALVQGSGLWNGDPDTAKTTLTLNGNGRLIEGAATISFENTGPAKQWWYRADLGDWRLVTTVAATDELPFAPEIDDLWILNLTMRLAPRYGKTLAPATLEALKEMRRIVSQNYSQKQDTQYNGADIPNSWQSYSTNFALLP
jgi:hypothetical protein